MRAPLASAALFFAFGCVDREAMAPSALCPQDAEATRAPALATATARVRCRCDGAGGLHVTAPAEAVVSAVPDAEDATVDVSFGAPTLGPIRRTKSLGYIGDGKLTPSRSRGGPWAAHDALLPPHHHASGSTGIHFGRYGRWR